MNATDVLRYGQLTLLGAVERVPDSIEDRPGACGVWSIKDIVAHLSSYEAVLIDILGSAIEDRATPVLDRYRDQGASFNDIEVNARKHQSMTSLLAEINEAHGQTLEMIAQIDANALRQPGSIPWYGAEYALDDLIVYMYYGHKREHAAQIEVFRDAWFRKELS
jgi:hypothetical protein